MSEPKRVLIIGLTERMGGVETFICQTTLHSDPSRYRYDYLIHGADHCVFQEEIASFYGEAGHFTFIEKYKGNPLTCIRDLLRFYWKQRRTYDYIHLQTGAASEILYVFPFCLMGHAKVVVHSHNGNGYSPTVNRLFRPVVNLIAWKRLACSDVAAEWLFGEKHAKACQFLQNGIDTARFSYRPEGREKVRWQYGIGSELLIGHIGRFSEQKNHPFLLEIFRAVRKSRPDARLMLVGTGEKEAEIRRLVCQMELEPWVIFAGVQQRTEDYYSAFDCFVMPSLYEGLPIVGIEAQASGLFCLFSDSIDRKILQTQRAKQLPLTASAEEWSRELLIHTASDRREWFGAQVRQAGFDIQGTVAALEEVYQCGQRKG